MAIRNISAYLLILGTNEQLKKLATLRVFIDQALGNLVYVDSDEILERNGAEYLPELK